MNWFNRFFGTHLRILGTLAIVLAVLSFAAPHFVARSVQDAENMLGPILARFVQIGIAYFLVVLGLGVVWKAVFGKKGGK